MNWLRACGKNCRRRKRKIASKTFIAVPAVCSYFFQNTSESIVMFFKNRDQGIIIGAVTAHISMHDEIILYCNLNIICWL